MRGVTIAPSPASNGYDVNINPSAGGSQARATINSSLLLDRAGVTIANGAQATCTLHQPAAAGFSGTPNCPTADGNPLGNTKLMTSQLRLDPDLAPLYDSPAVDSGDPAGVAPGESPGRPPRPPPRGVERGHLRRRPGRPRQGRLRALPPAALGHIAGPDSFPAGTATFSGFTDSRDPVFTWACGDGADGGGGHDHARLRRRRLEDDADRHRPRLQLLDAATKNFTVTAARRRGSKDKTAPKLSKVKLAKSNQAQGDGDASLHALGGRDRDRHRRPREGQEARRDQEPHLQGQEGRERLKLTAKRLKWRKARYGVQARRQGRRRQLREVGLAQAAVR